MDKVKTFRLKSYGDEFSMILTEKELIDWWVERYGPYTSLDICLASTPVGYTFSSYQLKDNSTYDITRLS